MGSSRSSRTPRLSPLSRRPDPVRLRDLLRILLVPVLALASCSGTLVIDASIPAVEAGDYTLAGSACDGHIGDGFSVCRVKQDTRIDSVWSMVVPPVGGRILGVEVDIFYRDLPNPTHMSTKDAVVTVAWKDILHATTWTQDLAGEAEALVDVKYQTDTGLTETAKFKSGAKILVLAPGYERMPMDSTAAVGWETTCKVQYSTAGRSAVSCK